MQCGFSIEFSTVRSPNRVLTTLKSASKIRILSFVHLRLGGVNLTDKSVCYHHIEFNGHILDTMDTKMI